MSDSDRITAQQLWNDVAAILINSTILTEDMEYQVPEQNYNQQRFQDFANKTHRFKFQTIKYYFEEQTNYQDENDFFLPEVAQKLPNMESFTKLKVLELREKTSKMPLNHYVNMAYVIKHI
jgi:hypothetical protein